MRVAPSHPDAPRAAARARLARAAAAATCLTLLAAGRPAAPPPAAAYQWRNAVITGGGFVDGIVFSQARPGLAYARTDIGGAYRWDPHAGRWVPLMDFTGFNDWNTLGVESIAADPADPGKVWVAAGEYTQSFAGDGEILRSSDQGRHWRITPLPIQLGSNQDGRGTGERLVADPGDDRVLYLGSPVNGLWRSTDGGATWAQVTSFPVTSTPGAIGVTFVTFGPHTGRRGTPTRVIFAGVATSSGPSLYASTDAGATWHPVPGAPAGQVPQHGALAGGTLYTDYADQPGPNGMTSGSVWKYRLRSGAWTDITPQVPGAGGNPPFGYGGLAVDTRHPGTVMAATNDRWSPIDDIYRSTDGGAHWASVSATATLDISASPFLAWGAAPKFGWWIATVAIDPFDSAHVLYGTGATVFGSADVTAMDRGGTTHWSSAAASGIEETAVQDLLAPAAGPCTLISAVGDLGGFCHKRLVASPAGGMSQPILSTGTSLAQAGRAPLDVVRVGWSGGSYSTDGGGSWTAMALPPGEPDGAGVAALAADGGTVVWAPENFSWAPEPGTPVRSTDRGQTWAAVSGLPAGDWPVADPVDPAVFYAFDPATGSVLRSADGGASFHPAATGLPAGVGAEETSSLPQLHPVPGRAGDLWLASGSGALYRSVDGGTSFSPVTSVTTVATLGFGKAAPGSACPAVYLSGVIGGEQGFFRSTDAGAHWLRISDPAHAYAWTGQAITGDPRVFGRVYLGTNGRGIVYADPLRHK